MKILETQATPQFKPVTILLETPEELQYLAKLVGMGSDSLYRELTKDTTESSPAYYMYKVLDSECVKQGISIDYSTIAYNP